MFSRRFRWDLLTVALTCSALAGCGKNRTSFELIVDLGPDLHNATVAVDVVGVNDAEKWKQIKISEYWSPGNKERRSAMDEGIVHSMKFSSGGKTTETLNRNDGIWSKWTDRNAWSLFVLADLPGTHADKPGAADPRRLVLPLQGDRWPKDTKIVRINLRSGGMTPVPGPEDG